MSETTFDRQFPLDPALHEFLKRQCESEDAYRFVVLETQLEYMRTNRRLGRPYGGALPMHVVTGYQINPAWMYVYNATVGWQESYRPGYHLTFNLSDGTEFGLLLYCNAGLKIDCGEGKEDWQTRAWLRKKPWVRDV